MNTDINNEEFTRYSTSDIYFAAYLGALDIPLETAEPKIEDGTNHKKMVFVFKVPVRDMARLKSSYFGSTGNVKAMRFVQQLRSLKSMCYT